MKVVMSIKRTKRNREKVYMPQIFEGIKTEFSNYSINFEYENDNFIVNLESTIYQEEELEKIFWSFYSYLHFILGYFPYIISATFFSENELINIAEQYKTNEYYIRNDQQYIRKIPEEIFKDSFIKFLEVEKKANLAIEMFDISTMTSNCYAEIAIINTLQSLEGLFNMIYKVDILKETFEKMSLMDLENINDKGQKNLKYIMNGIDKIKFKDKLLYLCDKTKYDVFKYEKLLNSNNKYNFNNLIQMFVNTRNKFSHSDDKTNVLNTKEARTYHFKTIILYRVLILQKIELIDLISEEEFLNDLDGWNKYISETLKEN